MVFITYRELKKRMVNKDRETFERLERLQAINSEEYERRHQMNLSYGINMD